MSITKKFLKTKPVCKVTFQLPPEEAGQAQSVSLCGDFNNWDPAANPMRRQKNGSFTLALDLPVGGTQRFRYLADGAWLNDAEADSYEYCAFAQADNSILEL